MVEFHSTYDYGRTARIGIGTPQANPTVEAEFSILFPRTISIQATRLTCESTDPLVRIRNYLENLDTSLKTYHGMNLDAFGFACTASAYLLGQETENKLLNDLSDKYGYLVQSATQAIELALNKIGAEHLVLISPYPKALSNAAKAYWEEKGFTFKEVASVKTRTSDTETIYELTSHDGAVAIESIASLDSVDAILLSGTGMPTLPAISAAEIDIPIFSSNQCLAWSLLSSLGLDDLLSPKHPHILGWETRLKDSIIS